MTQVRLEEVATIRAATLFREKAPTPSENGNVRALTIKDVVANWPVNPQILPTIEVATDMLSHCLSGGEVLIPGRGDKYPARYFDEQSENVFPYGQVNIIVPNNRILGRYLSWYINLRTTQDEINRSLTGTSIKALVRSRLLDLQIEIPSLETQASIGELQRLRDEGKFLRERLAVLEEQEIEWACRKLLSETKSKHV